jgi:hypothetical protein
MKTVQVFGKEEDICITITRGGVGREMKCIIMNYKLSGKAHVDLAVYGGLCIGLNVVHLVAFHARNHAEYQDETDGTPGYN